MTIAHTLRIQLRAEDGRVVIAHERCTSQRSLSQISAAIAHAELTHDADLIDCGWVGA